MDRMLMIGAGVALAALGGYTLYATRDKEPDIIKLLKEKGYVAAPASAAISGCEVVMLANKTGDSLYSWAEKQQKAGKKVFYAVTLNNVILFCAGAEKPKVMLPGGSWRTLEPLSFGDKFMHPGFAPDPQIVGQTLPGLPAPTTQKA